MALTDRQIQTLQNALNLNQDPVERSITVNDIQNFVPPMNSYQRDIYDQMDRYNRAIGQLPESTYFPGGNENIYKGSYSGPTIGNVPVFAPNQQVPFGIYGARQDQLRAAAAQKAKSIDDFFKMAKPPETSRFSVQADLDEAYYNGLTQWMPILKQRYGSNWAQAANSDVQFQQWNQTMNTVAKYNTGLVEKVSQLEALDKDPNFVLAPSTRKYANAVIAGYGGLANAPWDPNSYGLGQNLLRMNAETDLDVAVNNALKEYTDQAYSANPSHYANGIYDVWTEVKEHGMSDDQISKMADGIWKNSYGANSDYFSKEDIENRLRALYPIRAEKELKFQTNQFSNAGGEEQVYDPSAINPEGVAVTYKGADNGVTTYDGQTFNKLINLNVPNDINTVNPETGERTNIPANSKVQIGKTFNILVTNDGAPVAGNQVPQGQDPADYHYETYAAGTINTGSSTTSKGMTSTTTPTTKTVWIPVDAIKSGLMVTNADGTYKSGAHLDIQKGNAQQRTEQLRKTPAAQSNIIQNPTEAQYNSLPSGAQFIYNGKTYTKQ